MTTTTTVTIRVAGPGDAAALERLAALDSAAPLTGTVLVAESGGGAVAALSFADDRAIADPFVPTARAVALLRAYAVASRPARPRGGLARSLARVFPARLRPI